MKGHLRKRSDTSWTLEIYLGRDDVTGKPRYKSITIRGNKRHAERERIRILAELQGGTFVEEAEDTVTVYLASWLKQVSHTVSPKTYQRYAQIAELHIVPALGKIKLSALKPSHIQRFYTECRESGHRLTGKALSPRSVLHIHRLFRKALQDAVRLQMLVRNPCDSVTPPKATRPEMRIFTDAEIALILNTAYGTSYYLPCLLAVSTGMRRGEILALKWMDVDLDARKLYVRRSVEQIGKAIREKTPKTETGRLIPLGLQVVDILRQVQEAQNGCTEYVCYYNGRVLKPDSLSSDFYVLLERARLPRIPFHNFRHTFATEMLKAGVHPKVVQEILGHSNIGITLDTYSHVVPTMMDAAVSVIDNYLANIGKISARLGGEGEI